MAEFKSIEDQQKKYAGKFLYCIKSPSFPGWYKIGITQDIKSRLNQYNTSNPYRDYEVIDIYFAYRIRDVERRIIEALSNYANEVKCEWINIDKDKIQEIWNLFKSANKATF